MRSKIKPLVLIVVFLLAAFLRIIPLIHNGVFFGFDQGLDMIMVKQLVVDHKLNLISRYSGLEGVLMGPLWTWFLAVPFLLSGGNPAANMLYLVIFSLAATVAAYFIVRRIWGEKEAVATYIFLLLSPHFIGGSQVVLSPLPLAYLFFFFIWCAYEIMVNRRDVFWLLWWLLVGVFFQLEIGFAVFTLPVILALLLIFKKTNTLKSRYFFLGLGILLLTFLPQVIFDIRHRFLMANSLLHFLTGENRSLYGSALPLYLRFWERAKTMAADFIQMAMPLSAWYFILPVTLLALWGWITAYRQKLVPCLNVLKILLTVLAVFYLGFSLYPGPLWAWYRAGLPVVYALLIVIPFAVLWQSANLTRYLILGLSIWGLSASLVSGEGLAGLTNPGPGDTGTLRNQIRVVDYVYHSAGGNKFAFFAYTPPVYDYIWQYDFYWYGRKTYGYAPQNLNVAVPPLGIGEQVKIPRKIGGLYYLILEPDRDRPAARAEWQKGLQRMGKILEQKDFPGNISVVKLEGI